MKPLLAAFLLQLIATPAFAARKPTKPVIKPESLPVVSTCRAFETSFSMVGPNPETNTYYMLRDGKSGQPIPLGVLVASTKPLTGDLQYTPSVCRHVWASEIDNGRIIIAMRGESPEGGNRLMVAVYNVIAHKVIQSLMEITFPPVKFTWREGGFVTCSADDRVPDGPARKPYYIGQRRMASLKQEKGVACYSVTVNVNEISATLNRSATWNAQPKEWRAALLDPSALEPVLHLTRPDPFEERGLQIAKLEDGSLCLKGDADPSDTWFCGPRGTKP